MNRAADRAYLAIRERILAGSYEPGQPLREERLAESIGVSRTPIREALGRLVAEGFLLSEPNRGVTVATWTKEEVQETFELRAMLEGYAARLVAERASDEVVDDLAQLCDEMESTYAKRGRGAIDEVAHLNEQFHSGLLHASGHRRLETLMAGLIEVHIGFQTFRQYSEGELLRSFQHHREILDAVRAHDGDWSSLVMRSHVLSARQVLLSNEVD